MGSPRVGFASDDSCRSDAKVVQTYFGNKNDRPLQVGEVATMNEPVLVRATALMVVLPNLAERMFLQDVGVALRVLKFLLADLAQRATCVELHVWITAPLLIQLVKLFSVVGLGQEYLPGPLVWLKRVLNELILDWIVLHTPL